VVDVLFRTHAVRATDPERVQEEASDAQALAS